MEANEIKNAANEAMAADSYICLGKELLYLVPLIDEHVKQSREKLGMDGDELGRKDRFLEIGIPALKNLIEAYKKEQQKASSASPESADPQAGGGESQAETTGSKKDTARAPKVQGESEFVKEIHLPLGGTEPQEATTIKDRITAYKESLETALAYIGYRLGSDLVDELGALAQLRVLEETAAVAKAHLDMCQERSKRLVQAVRHPDIKAFLDTSTIGDISKLFSWVSEIKSPNEVCTTQLNLFNDAVEKYENLAKKGAAELQPRRKSHLEELEKKMKEFREILKSWEDSDTGVEVKIPSDQVKTFIIDEDLYRTLKAELAR